MKEIILKNEEFQENLSNLEKYILFNKNQEEAQFREYRDIIYGAMINRGYTLWETYVKDIFFEYFTMKKEEYFKNNTLIEKYRLNELPGFLFEAATFSLEDESISFKLNKELVSFTSKNMDIAEMSKLFKKIDIDIKNKLDNNSELVQAVDLFEVAFENGLQIENKTTQALKRIIQERNLVSHYAHLDSFQNIDIVLEWIKYYKVLGRVICKTICLEYVKTVDGTKKIIGECKQIVRNNIMLVDIDEGIKVDYETKLFVYSNENIIDVVIPKSFKVEDNDVSYVEENNKAGIVLESIFNLETKMKKEYRIYKIENLHL